MTSRPICSWLIKYVFIDRSVPPASCVESRATPRGTVLAATALPAAFHHMASGPARGPHYGTNTASAVVWSGTSLMWASLSISFFFFQSQSFNILSPQGWPNVENSIYPLDKTNSMLFCFIGLSGHLEAVSPDSSFIFKTSYIIL